ncbi:50S ribosomal protein L31 [Candidatus Roizmanbacteria bacterium CG_4_9_14_0_2_um_filter_39_13]|uniref:Large ribosomal subunit protein bL31 n=1 Tax=Candidatus Roizmanbacteria bacterium CG_4_9_14_0_2_um_filter_39_13 TaxID=1974839 RepID=A0A2M8F4N9_9BACT|nr:MAG: 50S ribosomal protein L31 [Candidatus Roizmanbacteria bacterium CG_4_9_14_0_2_um_filter_39_13]
MQAKIHPQFYEDAFVSCACGNTFTTGSTKKNIIVEVCAKCHPFYTGEQKFLDTKGTVEKFLQKEKQAKAYKKVIANKKDKKSGSQNKKTKSLRELLGE